MVAAGIIPALITALCMLLLTVIVIPSAFAAVILFAVAVQVVVVPVACGPTGVIAVALLVLCHSS